MNNQEQRSKIVKSLKELKEALDEDPKSTRTEKAREAVGSAMDSEARNFLFEVVYRSCGKNTKQCIDELQDHPGGYPALRDAFAKPEVIADIASGGNAGEIEQNHPIWTRGLGIKKWAEIFSVSESTIRRWFKDNKLKNQKASDRKWKILYKDLPAEVVARVRNQA